MRKTFYAWRLCFSIRWPQANQNSGFENLFCDHGLPACRSFQANKIPRLVSMGQQLWVYMRHLVLVLGMNLTYTKSNNIWWTLSDSNRGLPRYERGALTNWAKSPCVVPRRIELLSSPWKGDILTARRWDRILFIVASFYYLTICIAITHVLADALLLPRFCTCTNRRIRDAASCKTKHGNN